MAGAIAIAWHAQLPPQLCCVPSLMHDVVKTRYSLIGILTAAGDDTAAMGGFPPGGGLSNGGTDRCHNAPHSWQVGGWVGGWVAGWFHLGCPPPTKLLCWHSNTSMSAAEPASMHTTT